MKKYLLTVLILLCFNVSANSQTQFIENFNFPVRDSLEGIGSWLRSGGNSPYNVKVINPGLTYAGYLGSGIGNSAVLTNEPNGDICLNQFGFIDTGKVYLSFLIRVDSLTPTATEGYNVCLDQEGGTTNLNTKPYIKRLSSSTFNFGIRKSDSITNYSGTVYSTNTTYLVIVSYTFKSGSVKDTARIYVSTSGVPATEPSSPAAVDFRGSDIADIGDLILTNSYVQSGLQRSSVKIDGIRVGTTWANTLFGNINRQYNFTGLIQGFYNNVTNKMVKDTARIILRYSASPYLIADSAKAFLDSLGNGIFIFNKIGNRYPYYLVFKHRNSIETWSNTGKEFEANSLTYDFTLFPNRAYGNNLVLKGTEYCFYNGDVQQDGVIDGTDGLIVDNAAAIFTSGYVVTDVNGDTFVDGSDAAITDNNALNFVSVIRP